MVEETTAPEVRAALAQLLLASREFSHAYDACAHAPAAWTVEKRERLERAERALADAEREAASQARLARARP